MQNGDSFGQLMIQEKELKIKSNLYIYIYSFNPPRFRPKDVPRFGERME